MFKVAEGGLITSVVHTDSFNMTPKITFFFIFKCRVFSVAGAECCMLTLIIS